ncbi:hypothetical protein Tco_0575760 [Tanacetum coccineum]
MEFVDEAQIFKCQKHPSRKRKSGICPKCLRDRLATLCPDCATALPCPSCPPPVIDASSSSSSSSSSFSLFSFSRGGSRHVSAISTNSDTSQLPNKVEADPMLLRSRSSAIPFLRSRSRYVGGPVSNFTKCDVDVTAVPSNDNSNNTSNNNKPAVSKVSRSKINFWSVFTAGKSKKSDVIDDGIDNKRDDTSDKCELRVVNDNSMMARSRSVAVGGGNRFAQANSKQKGWNFPSPMKGFRHAKPPNSVTVA